MSKNITAFSRALFEIAIEENKQELYVNNAKELLSVMEETSLEQFLSDPHVDLSEKEDLLNKAFDKESEYFVKWILIIVEARAARKLKLALMKFIKMINKSNGVVEATAFTTRKLTKAEVTDLEKAISKAENRSVSIENKIDKALIGGIRVEVDDNVYDNSVRRKLSELSEQIIKGEQ